MKETLQVFKSIPFDKIHETILQILRGILIIDGQGNQTQPKIKSLTDDEFSDLIELFSIAIDIIKKKVFGLDINKLTRLMTLLFTHLNNICSLIINSNFPERSKTLHCLKYRRITENIIDTIFACCDKRCFSSLDMIFGQDIVGVLATKIAIARTMFNFITLVGEFYQKYKLQLVSGLCFNHYILIANPVSR